VRVLAFRPSERFAYYCKVQLNMEGSLSFTQEQFLETASGFLSDFLPELMRCLPDWAEVESRGSSSSAIGTSALAPANGGSPNP
jgi:hypothetical protein